MPSCPHISECGLQRNLTMREALGVWQSFYCQGCFARCERFKLVVAGITVPEKLLPNGRVVDRPQYDALAAAAASHG